MIVLYNCLSAISGGAVSYNRNMLPELNRLFEGSVDGHQLRILLHESQEPFISDIPGAQCIFVKGHRLTGVRRLLWEWRHLEHVAQEERADVLFCPYQIGRSVANAKLVLMIRNMEPFLFQRYRYGLGSRLRNHLLRCYSARALRSADRVIAVSQFAKDLLTNQLSVLPGRICQIYHGRDTRLTPTDNRSANWKLLSELGLKSDFVLTCGSLRPYRRCEDVISAFAKLKPGPTNGLTLIIAGSEDVARYGKAIRRAIAQSACGDSVRMVGHVSWEMMRALYQCCKVCVIASEIEACPNIAIEAMTSGCVIVASDQPPLPEMFHDSAVYFRSRNVADLADKMQLALLDANLREQLQTLALRRSQGFSWRTCAAKTFQALVQW